MFYPYYLNTCPYCQQQTMLMSPQSSSGTAMHIFQDQGPNPFVINIEDATKQNNMYRNALWTGKYLQLTLMSISPGEDIGLEMHSGVDQFIRIEEGRGLVEMGKSRNELSIRQYVGEDSAIFVPAGTWHNVTNNGSKPMKLYTIYAPPNHPFGTVERTKAEAEGKHN